MLKYCSECGGQVSDTAAVCPHCGAPLLRRQGRPWRRLGLDPEQPKSLLALRWSIVAAWAMATVVTLADAPRRLIDNPSYVPGRSLRGTRPPHLDSGPDWFAAFLLVSLWTALALGAMWLVTWLHRPRKKIGPGKTST